MCAVRLAVVKAVSDLFKPSVFFSANVDDYVESADHICPTASSADDRQSEWCVRATLALLNFTCLVFYIL